MASATKHTIDTTLTLTLATEECELSTRITYRYFPAQSAYTPRGERAPVDPPEPEGVEDVGIFPEGLPLPDAVEEKLAQAITPILIANARDEREGRE